MAAQVEDLKWVRGTNFIVDGFRFQHPRCRRYFLTHAHSDHTTGLYRSFDGGQIYCTHITAALLVREQGIPAARVTPVSLDQPHMLDGVKFTFIDANHCPGAAMILFEVPAKDKPGVSTVILHTGDMRWTASMAQHPALLRVRVDLLYLDTTYAAPKHVHPPQEEAIATMVELMRELTCEEPRTLFVVGAYHIGKERAYLGPARQLDCLVYCEPAKLRTLKMLGLPAEELALLTSDPGAARIHVSAMGRDLTPDALLEKMAVGSWTRVVGFRPTGWTFRKSGKLEVRREGAAAVYGIPYSEHSNFTELRHCVAALRPKRIIPTVNVTDSASSRRLVDLFAGCMDLSADRSRLDAYFRAPPGAASPLSAAMDVGTSREARAKKVSAKDAAWECAQRESLPVAEGLEGRKRVLPACASDGICDDCAAVADCRLKPEPCTVGPMARIAGSPPSPAAVIDQDERGSAHSCRSTASGAAECREFPAERHSAARRKRQTTSSIMECKPSVALAVKLSSQEATGAQPPSSADTPVLLADVDVQEQACFMAMFEARWSTSKEAATLAAAAACRAAPLSSAERSRDPGELRVSATPAATPPAKGLPAGKGKRQRTLLGFFSTQ